MNCQYICVSLENVNKLKIFGVYPEAERCALRTLLGSSKTSTQGLNIQLEAGANGLID